MKAYRKIDLEINESNGGRSIGGMIDAAKRQIDEHCRTILCWDGSGNDAIVLIDRYGVTRVCETRRNGEQNPDGDILEAIDEGVDPWLMVEEGEEVPLVPGAVYRVDDMEFVCWGVGDGTSTEGYLAHRYFEDGRYLGPDQHGIEPVMRRKGGAE